MYQLKGFIEILSLVNNTVGATAVFGEQSTWALTYTKEKGEYTSSLAPGYVLTSISSTDSVTGKTPVTQPYVDHVLTVAKWVADYGLSHSSFITRADFHDDLLAQFNTTMGTLNFGELISNGSYSVPTWISWINPLLPTNILKIWFSDTAFTAQYDGFDIVVIPPLDNIDDMFLPANVVQAKVNLRTISDTIDAIQTAKAKNPETVIRTEIYAYKNVNYPDVTFPTTWSLLIYGIAGDNVDSVKDAIIEHILDNSTHTRDDWTALLPDLFKRTEFIVLPRWDKFAIPDMSVQEGVYSPIMNLKECVTFAKSKITAFTASHIETYLTVHPSTYRSVSLLTIGNPENKDSLFKVSDVFADYIDVGTASTDFNRQAAATRDWSSLMEALVIAAESMTEFSDLPIGMRRLTRDGILYVAKVYLNIQYLVAAKINYVV